jgi:fructoselysine and glucoselysine-specific PTS system IIA component
MPLFTMINIAINRYFGKKLTAILNSLPGDINYRQANYIYRKMRKFLIATHGQLAKGIKSSLDIIIGPMENVFLIEAYVNENKSIEEEIRNVLLNISSDDELIVFSDLLGGSITNQVLRTAPQENVHVVSGFNLPLLIDVLLADAATPVAEVIETSIGNAREQIVYVNKLITSTKEESIDD